MALYKTKPRYVLEHRGSLPPTFFPEGYDTSDLMEVTTRGESFAVFLNAVTGETIRCEDFHNKARKEQGLL